MKKKYALLDRERVLKNIVNLRQLTFEVTDACNLKCKYCGYGEFYEGYDDRINNKLPIEKALNLLRFLTEKWKSSDSMSHKKDTFISFYGGEPLLNFPFIKEIVSWINEKEVSQCNFKFNMTTNGVLLKKYLGFFIENDFQILVSLDGNEYNHSYRVDYNGKNSYQRIFKDLKIMQKENPDFFDKNISFNAVLHNRNNYEDLISFFKKEFGKRPTVAELSPLGIKTSRIQEFSKMYNMKERNIENSASVDKFKEELFIDAPETDELFTFLYWHSGNVFNSYNDLLSVSNEKLWIPTGTCLPFEKKMFVTVNGKILPCERISHEYALGEVRYDGVFIDIDNIVEKYNAWYKKYIIQCESCYNNHTCRQCLFYNEDLSGKAKCNNFMSRMEFESYQNRQYEYLAKHPHLYKKLMEDVVLH